MTNYYKENKDEFINSTISCDMSFHYHLFEKYLKEDSKTILDIGFGSGRDSLYFKDKGYDVTSIDPVVEFCDHGIKIGLDKVGCMRVQDMTFDNEFDGIWACASLLHITTYEMVSVLNKCYNALNSGGVMYCSFGSFSFSLRLLLRKLLLMLSSTGGFVVSLFSFLVGLMSAALTLSLLMTSVLSLNRFLNESQFLARYIKLFSNFSIRSA